MHPLESKNHRLGRQNPTVFRYRPLANGKWVWHPDLYWSHYFCWGWGWLGMCGYVRMKKHEIGNWGGQQAYNHHGALWKKWWSKYPQVLHCIHRQVKWWSWSRNSGSIKTFSKMSQRQALSRLFCSKSFPRSEAPKHQDPPTHTTKRSLLKQFLSSNAMNTW